MEFSNKFGQYRRTLLSYAEGRVLEMGFGTGANLSYYNGPQVTELVGVDWSEAMLIKAFGKLDDLKLEQEESVALSRRGIDVSKEAGVVGTTLPENIKLMRADCLSLHALFPDDSFDCVVDTLTLNSVYNRELLANEMKRVVRPGGRILLLERGQSHLSVYN